MKARPIIFSAPMVRALLNGSKTQTRRVAKLTANGHVKEPRGQRRWHPADPEGRLACPYGQAGDQLWVRETWLQTNPFTEGGLHTYGYRATDSEEFPDAIWKPCIHMPRAASRITLEITDVRVERLQGISETDAIDEGIQRWPLGFRVDVSASPKHECMNFDSYANAYRYLWESINGPGSWDANPWVWMIEFKRVEGGAA